MRVVLAMLAVAAGTAACSGGSPSPPSSPAGFAVGARTQVVGNSGTPTNGPGPRRLVTTVWYPATGPAGRVLGGDAKPDTRHGPYPLIVFAHGFGAPPDLSPYTTLLARWASAGYVVAAPRFPRTGSDAPGGPDLSDFPNQPGDVVAVADAVEGGPLAGMVDARHIGVAGHSLGGVTVLGLVANTCCRTMADTLPIDAAVVMSGDPIAFPTGHPDFSHTPPLLLVHGDADPVVPYVSSIDSYNAAHAPKGLLTVVGGNHDAPVVPTGRAFRSVVRTTTDFFDAYLKHRARALARWPTGARRGVTTLHVASTPGAASMLPRPTIPVAHPHATVTPDRGLTDGQTVTVSWDGYAPGTAVNVLECAHNPPTAAGDCDLKAGVLLHPDPTGSASVPLTVHTGPVGSGGGVCGVTHPGCVIAVNQGGSTDPGSTVTVGIAFATG